MLEALEAWAPAVALRHSLYAYPLVNSAHVLGIALLVGAIVPLDLRLAGMWPSLPVGPLHHALTRMALTGFILAAASGVLLFLTRATEYASAPLFLLKMGLIVLAGLNALWLWRQTNAHFAAGSQRPLRLAATLSAILWVGALLTGRLVGYY